MASVWAELKRRNVVKVAVAYAIVGWILIEISATVFPIVQLPDWAVTLVTMLLLLGFPVALVLSWAYELTPEGLKPAHEVDPSDSITHVTGRKLDFLIIGVLVLAVGFLVFNYVLVDEPDVVVDAPEAPPVEEAQPAPEPVPVVAEKEEREVLPNSVAVLPFENLSPNADDEYFAAGIHEETLNRLAKLANLSVISRTSVLRYRDSDLTVPQIAAELNVGTIMEGSVRYAGDRVRITAQLIDAATDEHLWSEVYEREFADIFAIQADIAMNIANALEAEFSTEEQATIEKEYTYSPEAYAYYLRALTLFLTDRQSAHDSLDKAISLDPEFALAYALKADIYVSSLVDNIFTQASNTTKDYEALALETARRAISLDANLAEAHYALGSVHEIHWRWDEADQAYSRSLQLSLNDAARLWQVAWFHMFSGRHEEAIKLAKRAVELDPTDPEVRLVLGATYMYTGDADMAAATISDAIIMSPDLPGFWLWSARTDAIRGRDEAALSMLQQIEEALGGNFPAIVGATIAYTYAKLNRPEDARRVSNIVKAMAEEGPIGAGSMVQINLATGDSDAAFLWLQRAVEKVENEIPDAGFYNLMFVKANIFDDPVLEEPRFVELRNKLGEID